MAKKKKKNVSPAVEAQETVNTETEEKSAPRFEIGQKGDEFDISYSRAVRNANADADELLTDLSQEQGADRYNFIGFTVPVLVLLFFAISFILINRSDFSEVFTVKLSTETVMDGSYLSNLTYAYNTTLPFGDGLSDVGELLGFAPKSESDEEPEEEEIEEPVEFEEPEVTEPVVTTVATTTEVITTATTEVTEEEVPDTYIMYAAGTVNIRLEPSNDAMMLGYFSVNAEVDVIEIREDGWAEIYYSGIRAYVYAEYLSDTKVVVTTTTEATTEATTTEETTEATTTVPEETTEVTTTTEETTTEATTTTRINSNYPGTTYTMPTVTAAPATTSPTTESTTESTTASSETTTASSEATSATEQSEAPATSAEVTTVSEAPVIPEEGGDE
ncbi:MAG: SH3 domain-containing protein [Oscillospiraceae bacterium]|nr:SH3 domain-containing protein [Oscillospiraceae bacterium]